MFFHALIWLTLDYNQLTSLDVSNNTSLQHLDFYDSQLVEIPTINLSPKRLARFSISK